MARIGIVGAGALGRELMAWLRQSVASSGWGGELVFVDDVSDRAVCKIDDAAAVGFNKLGGALMIAIADPAGKRSVDTRLMAQDVTLRVPFKHATAMMADDVDTPPGLLLFPFSLVSTGARLGRCVTVNTHCAIGHDVTVGDYSTLSSFVNLCGHVWIGEGVFLGAGAIVLPGVTVGDGAYVGAGSVVVADVKPGDKVFGVPSRVLRS